jgi:carbamoyltransferase
VIFCGLKLTHDGSVAVLDDDRLIGSIEMEKLRNNPRYQKIADLNEIADVLALMGLEVDDIDVWAIDGWDGRSTGSVTVGSEGHPLQLTVGGYRESAEFPNLLQPSVHGEFPLAGKQRAYVGHTHAATHLAGAYCSSPFAATGDPAFVLLWDGGLFPQLYHVDPAVGVQSLGSLFPVLGHAYALAGFHFGPYVRGSQPGELWVAGKLMAYIALGKPRTEIISILREEFDTFFVGESDLARTYRARVGGYGSKVEPSREQVEEYFTRVAERTRPLLYSNEDVLASIHQFFQECLAERMAEKMSAARGVNPHNLVLAGGCALNIKWNSALREHPAVRQTWVPPFCNDSGSAIGAAVLAWAAYAGLHAFAWTVRSGPPLGPAPATTPGWSPAPATAEDIAEILYRTDEPVMVLDGRAELGPRALGGRSILASPLSATMKERLNGIKDRESYRPIAPICLVAEAPGIFAPGSPDPYMLFDHLVRPEWVDRIPAVLHLDGTARLETVDPEIDPEIGRILHRFQELSGVPVLCNTSANRNGSGFFPDVRSAIDWGKVQRIWSEGILYTRHEHD